MNNNTDKKEIVFYSSKLLKIIATNGFINDHNNLELNNMEELVVKIDGEPHMIKTFIVKNGDIIIGMSGSIKNGVINLKDLSYNAVKEIVFIMDLIYTKYDDEKEYFINPVGKEEIVEVKLSPAKTPIAYYKKLKEYLDNGMPYDYAVEMTEESIPMEIMYERGYGLFMVESEILGSSEIVSPYSSEKYTMDPDSSDEEWK